MKEITVSQEVYGIFRSGQRITIRAGEITSRQRERFTVDYHGFFYTYLDTDVGKHVFQTLEDAEAAVERFERDVKSGFYE